MAERVWVSYTKNFKHWSGPRFAGEKRYETSQIAGLVCSAGVAASSEFETGQQPSEPVVIQPDTGVLGQQAS